MPAEQLAVDDFTPAGGSVHNHAVPGVDGNVRDIHKPPVSTA